MHCQWPGTATNPAPGPVRCCPSADTGGRIQALQPFPVKSRDTQEQASPPSLLSGARANWHMPLCSHRTMHKKAGQHLAQPQGSGSQPASQPAEPAGQAHIQKHCDVDVKDVSLPQRPRVGDAVADALIHGGAHTLGELAYTRHTHAAHLGAGGAAMR